MSLLPPTPAKRVQQEDRASCSSSTQSREGPGTPSSKAGEQGLILAALVSFVQQGRELQQELESRVDILSEVLQRFRNSLLGSMPSSPRPA